MKRFAHVTEVELIGDYRIRLSFADGRCGVVDLADELWGPLFEPLRTTSGFAEVRVDHECGTIVWPNGADFAPEWLYQVATRASPSP